MSSVWHRRPQCNIGPGISPVTIGTVDDSRKRPGSPALASSTRRRRANDDINAHSNMPVAMTGAVVVVASATSSVTHTMLASDIRRSINEMSRRLDWEDHCEDLDERGPDCFRRQYRMPQQTFEKTCRYTASLASTRPPFPRTLFDEMMSCIHQQCCTEKRVFCRQLRTLRSPIAQSDSKIPCRYHFQLDYELCACDHVLFSFKMRECPSSFIYSVIFNMTDERLNLGNFDFNI